MSVNGATPLTRYIRKTVDDGRAADRDLLARFLSHQDEAAFTALVRRHERLIRSAIAKVLVNPDDADDAFQATFLVLVQRARRIDWRAGLGPWLYGVAHRVAVKARARQLRQVRTEAHARPVAPTAAPDLSWREACDLLHAELDRLPDYYRLPLLLCYLEGKTRDEAAALLGLTSGTVKGQIRRGCDLLRARLIRRGVALSAGLLAAVAASAHASFPVVSPSAVLGAVRGPVDARVSELVREVIMRARLSQGMKAAMLLAFIAGAVGLGVLGHRLVGAEPGDSDKAPRAPIVKPPSDEAPKVPPAPVQPAIDMIGAGATALELAQTAQDADTKWKAIRILGNLRYEPAVPLLLVSLEDSHRYVRANAARALGDMKVADAAKPLTELLKTEKDGGVIQQTSLALTRLGATEALPALKGVAGHEDVQTRMWVLQAIGGLGGKKDVAFLAGYLDDPSQAVQQSTAQALENITGTDFGFPKRSGPFSPDEPLRRAKQWWQDHKSEFRDP